MPNAASLPPRRSGAMSSTAATAASSSRRCVSRSTTYVATIATTDGSAKMRSHSDSGGICVPNTTRLAGLEIGSTKLAALAMNAQMNRYGSGSTLAARVAA